MNRVKCHGCAGAGWVTASDKAQVCPLCKGDGDIEKAIVSKPAKEYDQDAIWEDIVTNVPMNAMDVVEPEVQKLADLNRRCIVHLMVDGKLSPHGDILFYHLQMDSITQGASSAVGEDLMEAKNYDVLPDGKLRAINGIPVSKHYRKFELWGVNDMFSNCLASPIALDPNRKGNPLFIDGSIMAFGAVFEDGATQEQIRASFASLISSLQSTTIYEGDTLPYTGRVLNLKIVPVSADFWHKNVDKGGSSSPESKVRDD